MNLVFMGFFIVTDPEIGVFIMVRRIVAASILNIILCNVAFAQNCDTRFTLRNNSGVALKEFYYAPSRGNSWGSERLGSRMLEPGNAITYTARFSENYDFSVLRRNGVRSERRNIDICKITEVIVNADNISVR